MRYGILSIDVSGANLGNRLIEYAIKNLLCLPAPAVTASMFCTPTDAEIEKLNACDFILLPGATILADGVKQGEALNSLCKIKVPKFCISAGGWAPKFKLNKAALKHITEPLGIRDPITYKQCLDFGVKSIFTGCATAFIPKLKTEKTDLYNIVGFSRDKISWQISYFERIAKKGKVVVAVQEKVENSYANKITSDKFTYEDPVSVYKCYSECSWVYTGRLHGCLPAMSQRKPVVFFGNTDDSRFSLLKYLGVYVNEMGEYKNLKYTPVDIYQARVSNLKSAFIDWKAQTVDKFVGENT